MDSTHNASFHIIFPHPGTVVTDGRRQKFKNSGVQELQEFRIKRAEAKWLGSLKRA
jgi:hypothetical protein